MTGYAASQGLTPGTPAYAAAEQDYVLRGQGPTASGYRSQLEDQRQTGRASLENQRFGHRQTLRSQPTYADLHPRPRPPADTTPHSPGAVIAPILAKVAAGQPLTPAEQSALNLYRTRPSTRGAGAMGGTAGAPGDANLPVFRTPEEARGHPSGTRFRTPDGRVMRVP